MVIKSCTLKKMEDLVGTVDLGGCNECNNIKEARDDQEYLKAKENSL
jgi:hypothetical protein